MDIESCLRENNIRNTKSRKTIVKVLEASESPIGADYIYEKCMEKGVKVDLSTVYRTLDLLEEKNIVNKFPTDNGSFNYILKSKWHKHTIKCEFCSKEVEIDCPMMQIEEIIKNKTGFTFIDKEIKIRCVCNECKKNKLIKKCKVD